MNGAQGRGGKARETHGRKQYAEKCGSAGVRRRYQERMHVRPLNALHPSRRYAHGPATTKGLCSPKTRTVPPSSMFLLMAYIITAMVVTAASTVLGTWRLVTSWLLAGAGPLVVLFRHDHVAKPFGKSGSRGPSRRACGRYGPLIKTIGVEHWDAFKCDYGDLIAASWVSTATRMMTRGWYGGYEWHVRFFGRRTRFLLIGFGDRMIVSLVHHCHVLRSTLLILMLSFLLFVYSSVSIIRTEIRLGNPDEPLPGLG